MWNSNYCLDGKTIIDAAIVCTFNGKNQLRIQFDDKSVLTGDCEESISIEHEDFFYMNQKNPVLSFVNVSYQLELPLTIKSSNKEYDISNPFFGLFYKNLRYLILINSALKTYRIRVDSIKLS